MHLLGLLNVTNLVATAGYTAIFILCLLQSCCVPTSSELTMGFAGALAAQGKLSIVGVIAVGVLGEVVGAYIAWAIGRYAGRAVVDRFGRYLLLTHHDLDRAEAWYDRHERFGVFGSRLLPVIRNFVAVPAGIAEVPLGRFGVLTAGGSLLWDGAWAGIGYGVGSHWHTIAKAFGDIGYVLAVVVVGAIAFAAYHRYRSYKEAASGGGTRGSARHAAVRAAPRAARRPDDGPWSRSSPGSDGTPAGPAATAGGERTGSVRWLASSSGRPPTPRRPEDGAPPGRGAPGDRGAPPEGAARPESGWATGTPQRGPSRPGPGGRQGSHEFADSPIVAWETAVAHRKNAPTVGPARPAGDGPASPPWEDALGPGPAHRLAGVPGASSRRGPGTGRLPLIGRFFPAPLAAKVPEVLFAFWVVKILTTAGGEATSDYLKSFGNIGGGGIEAALLATGLVLQFGTSRYRAFSYWFLAFAIAVSGTGVADFLHLDVGIPYAGTTLMWAVVLAAVFWLWQRSEGTLSIHSITTQRREGYYWAAVFATFALGTALGDFTAMSLGLGYLASGVLFGVLILLPALAWWKLGLNSIAAFWMSYVVTRPLGASFADYVSKPHRMSGIAYGDAPTAVIFAIGIVAIVGYLAFARPDVQPVPGSRAPSARPVPSSLRFAGAELDVD